MKKTGRRLTALALAFVLTLSMGQMTAFASWALGDELVERTVPLAEGVTYTNQSLWSASKGDLRTENYITYTPGGPVKPMVFSGTYVASTNTVASAAAQMEAKGYRVAAALNGGFFNTDGTIVGMLVTDGVVRSLDVENYTMLGFTNDGRVFIDEGGVSKKISWKQADGWNFSASLAGFNAYRNKKYINEAFLYNQDFSSRVNSSAPNVSAILRPKESGVMKMNGTMPMEVVSVADTAQVGVSFNGNLPEGCYMLYAEYYSGNEWLTDGIRALTPGQEVTVTVSSNSQWNDAAYGISGLYPLLRDGQVVPNLPAAANPYTAVGVKADGSAVFYTIDGRQSGYSVGATYSQVAQRLQELGCVSAVALDGGGSTNLGATMPGSSSFAIQNRPSETGRRVNNSILLVAPDAGPTGEYGGAYVTAPQTVVLAGADLPVSAALYDTAGYPMTDRVPVWTSDGGIVRATDSGPVFSCILPGTFTVSADPEGAGSLSVRVVDGLDSLRIRQEGSTGTVSSLTLAPGESVDLTASGVWRNLSVAMDDADVTWSVDSAVGTISETGLFKAANKKSGGSGTITAAAGGRTVKIPVTVRSQSPFTDIAGHWSEDYVIQLYDMGITEGYVQPDGTAQFKPDNKVKRGEMLTFITRLLGVDTKQYENVKLPFADADSMAGWVQPYVKAMYALGIFEGSTSNGKLYANVNSNVTREAAMTMLGRVLKAQASCDLSRFSDSGSVSAWARPYVETLVAQNVVAGSNGRLKPKAAITRGEMAKLLVEIDQLDKAPLSPRPEDSGAQAKPTPGGTYVNPEQPPVQPGQEQTGQPNITPTITNPSGWSAFD